MVERAQQEQATLSRTHINRLLGKTKLGEQLWHCTWLDCKCKSKPPTYEGKHKSTLRLTLNAPFEFVTKCVGFMDCDKCRSYKDSLLSGS